MRKVWGYGVLVVALGALLGACGGDGRPTITVAAAADLLYAFEELEDGYERRCGCDVVLTFGSSGQFATQIEGGLPADVFASADIGYVDALEGKGLVVSESIEVYAVGRIVLAVPAGSSLEPTDLGLLTEPGIDRIAMANPEHAPYGVAAREALESAGLWESVQAKLVLGENAAQASQFVETGDAQVGIIALSLAAQREGRLRYTLIDEGLHSPLRQAAAVLARSEQPELARGFIDYINSPEGRPVMREFGFLLPGEQLTQP